MDQIIIDLDIYWLISKFAQSIPLITILLSVCGDPSEAPVVHTENYITVLKRIMAFRLLYLLHSHCHRQQKALKTTEKKELHSAH